jgi:hypothetical protein
MARLTAMPRVQITTSRLDDADERWLLTALSQAILKVTALLSLYAGRTSHQHNPRNIDHPFPPANAIFFPSIPINPRQIYEPLNRSREFILSSKMIIAIIARLNAQELKHRRAVVDSAKAAGRDLDAQYAKVSQNNEIQAIGYS